MRFVDEEGGLDCGHDDEGAKHAAALPPGEPDLSGGRCRAEVGGDGADDTNGVEVCQAGHVFDQYYEEHWNDCGNDHPSAWDAKFVQLLENGRQLAIARHQELDGDEIDNRSVYRREQEASHDEANQPRRNVAHGRAEGMADKYLGHITEHVIADTRMSRSVHVAVFGLQAAQSVHGQAKKRGEEADLDHDDDDCGSGGARDRRFFGAAAWIEFHHAGGIGDSLDARERENNAHETTPIL